MSFVTAFVNGVPVLPRASALQTFCKTRRASRTDKETENAPSARKAVSARLTKGI